MAQVREHRNAVPIFALVAAAVGVAGSLASLYVSNPYPRVVGPLVVLGAVGWVVRRDPALSLRAVRVPPSLVASLYLLCLAGTVALYGAAGFRRTIPVHLALLGLLLFALALAIVSDSAAVSAAVLVVTGAVHRAATYYASALQIGNDAVWHTRIATEIAAEGTLTPLAAANSKYWYMPAHHLLVATVSSVGQVSGRHATFLAVTLPLVVVPVLTVHSIGSQLGYPTVGVMGGWLYLVADRSIGQSIHAIPTSTGVVFAAVALLAVIGYLYRGGRSYLAVFLLALGGQWLTHPISLFVTAVFVVSFVGGSALWERSLRPKGVSVSLASVAAVATQVSVVKYQGPGMRESVLDRIRANLSDILSFGGGGGPTLPTSSEFVRTGTSTLSPLQVLGVGILFGFGVFGALVWLGRTSDRDRGAIVGLGATVATASVAVYVPPIAGVGILFPLRWFAYLYVPLGLLAAAGAVATVGIAERRHAAVFVILLLLVTAPYAAVMSWNQAGSMDDPVFASSPTAQRLGATESEAATYDHVASYGGGVPAVADRIAANYLERGTEYPTSTYALEYSSGEFAGDGDRLLVDRAYAHTRHASYYVRYEGAWFVVYGPLPIDRSRTAETHTVVYTAGEDRIVAITEDRSS